MDVDYEDLMADIVIGSDCGGFFEYTDLETKFCCQVCWDTDHILIFFYPLVVIVNFMRSGRDRVAFLRQIRLGNKSKVWFTLGRHRRTEMSYPVSLPVIKRLILWSQVVVIISKNCLWTTTRKQSNQTVTLMTDSNILRVLRCESDLYLLLNQMIKREQLVMKSLLP